MYTLFNENNVVTRKFSSIIHTSFKEGISIKFFEYGKKKSLV